MILFSPTSFVSRLFGALRDRIVGRAGAVVLGVLLIGLLIWFAGPLIGLADVKWRAIAVASFLAVVLVVAAIRWWINRRRAKRLEEELSDSKMLRTRLELRSEIEQIRKQMQEAIAALNSSHLGGGRTGSAALYALPWYMVIGASGAGKSTILRNSSLDFPYSKHDPRGVQGLGGTRNCDWWFSDKAIFLDTAGRYTTEEQDREEWYAFLDLLRHQRPGKPINGVVVAIEVAELLKVDPDRVAIHAKVVRERIDELIERLGILFPVYIIFSKSDLIRGFVEFFDELDEDERDQVWGANIEVDLKSSESGQGEAFGREFDILYARLCALRMNKLALQRDMGRKVDVIDFPNQFMAGKERLMEFVSQVFRKDPYRETPLFNGFYFTSGAQEGTPVGRIVGSPLQRFGEVASAQETAGRRPQRAYFIHRLLKDVVLPNSRQVMRNRRKERRARYMKRGAMVTALLVMAGGTLALGNAYTERKTVVSLAGASSQSLAHQLSGKEAGDLPALFRAINGHYQDTGSLWAADLKERSIFVVREIDQSLAREFLKAMEPLFVHAVGKAAEQVLSDYLRHGKESVAPAGPVIRTGVRTADPQATSTAEAYDALKIYIFLNSPHVTEPGPLVDSFTGMWSGALEQSGVAKESMNPQRMRAMVDYYLRSMRLPVEHRLHAQGRAANQTLVDEVRDRINRISAAERIYLDLCDLGGRAYAPVDLATLLDGHPKGALVSSYRFPGIYTAKAWHGYVRKTMEELVRTRRGSEWVLGNAPVEEEGEASLQTQANLLKQVRQMYFADYSRHWFAMLSGISANRFESLQDASLELQNLSRPEGPVRALVKAIQANVEVSETGTAGSVFQGDSVEELRIPFMYLQQLVRGAIIEGSESWIARYLGALGAVQKDIAGLAASSDVDRETRQFAAKILQGGGNSELHRAWVTVNSVVEDMDARSAKVVASVLRAPLRNVWGTIVAIAQGDLDKAWKNRVLFGYKQTLAGRFPFARDGGDADFSDVEQFFREGNGTIAAFLDTELSPFAERRGGVWEPKRWLGIGMEFNPDFFVALNASQLISNSLFRPGKGGPAMGFSIYPFPSTALSESAVTVDGEEYRYRNGPQEWHSFALPASNPSARVRGVRAGSYQSAELEAEGQWAWLRLLSLAQIQRNPNRSDGSYVATWHMRDANDQPVSVTFRVRPDSRNNPFWQGSLQGFGLPTEISRRQPARGAAASDEPGGQG